jgi:hypothetical protein
MPAPSIDTTVNAAFFQPLLQLIAEGGHSQHCPELPDPDFAQLGILRVLESSPSGRGFLQEHGSRFERPPTHSNYFSTLRSPRRGRFLKDLHDRLVATLAIILPDRLASIPELASYECFAADGHWHKAATHDPRHNAAKMAVGHFYSLDLRSHGLRHLVAGSGLHEHDMSALKRVKPKGLRQGVPKGRRVLIVYDKAGIDFAYWKRCRQECAVYFLSRVRESMVYDWLADREWDRGDARNAGVQGDRRVITREGVELRIVAYVDPVTGKDYEFLTNEPDLPVGVIVELYRRRWETEKVFDEIKNKLGEKKAWGTVPETREAQARFIAMAHNLLKIYEHRLESDRGIENRSEDRRRAKRTEEVLKRCESEGKVVSTLVTATRKATQCSVKLIRWLRKSLRDRAAEAAAVFDLEALYAQS